MPTAPDCDIKPMPPGGGVAGQNVALSTTSAAALAIPMQFGPISRIPASRQIRTSSACSCKPCATDLGETGSDHDESGRTAARRSPRDVERRRRGNRHHDDVDRPGNFTEIGKSPAPQPPGGPNDSPRRAFRDSHRARYSRAPGDRGLRVGTRANNGDRRRREHPPQRTRIGTSLSGVDRKPEFLVEPQRYFDPYDTVVQLRRHRETGVRKTCSIRAFAGNVSATNVPIP